MQTTIESLSRESARRLLRQFREARAHGRLIDAIATGDVLWVHPRTQERLSQAETLETCLEALLAARAGERG